MIPNDDVFTRITFEQKPSMNTCHHARFHFKGFVGARIIANLEQWLLQAPFSNPSMLQMFDDRVETVGGILARDQSCREFCDGGGWNDRFHSRSRVSRPYTVDVEARSETHTFGRRELGKLAPDGAHAGCGEIRISVVPVQVGESLFDIRRYTHTIVEALDGYTTSLVMQSRKKP